MKFTTTMTITAVAGATLIAAAGLNPAAADAVQEEVFQLVQVAGQNLPVVTEENGDCRDELLAATLTLHAGQRWTLVTQEREVCGDQADDDEDREEGTYAVDGETIRFMDEDGDLPQDDGDDSELEIDDLLEGVRTDTGLTVRVVDGETELQFSR